MSEIEYWTADVIIDDVVEKLAFRWPKSKIKAYLEDALLTDDQKKEGKKISIPVMEAILAAARKKRNEIMAAPFAEIKTDSITFYNAMVAKTNTSDDVRLKAQGRLDLLLGVEKLANGLDTPEEQAAKARQALKDAAGLMGEEKCQV